MVAHSRTPMGTHGLRPLGLPRPLVVAVDASGWPRTVTRQARVCAVTEVEDVWRVAEAWWREAPLGRTYVRVLLEGGVLLTLFHDDARAPGDGWHEQRY